MLHSLRGRTAVITGGSRGIGLAIAQNFARQGANTIIVGRNNDTLETALKSISAEAARVELSLPSPSSSRSETCCVNTNNSTATEQNIAENEFRFPHSPPKESKRGNATEPIATFHESFQGDVSTPRTWSVLTDNLQNGRFGKKYNTKSLCFPPEQVHTLVNCAGIAQSSFHHQTSDEDHAKILNVNLFSAMLGCKYMGKYMARAKMRSNKVGTSTREAQAYSIINVSSILAWRGASGAAAYAASKAGILGLTSALAAELGVMHGIRVNAIVPGYIDTDMTMGLGAEKLLKDIPLNRIGRPEEVADAAAFLAQNSYASNCILNIDGGATAAGFRHPTS